MTGENVNKILLGDCRELLKQLPDKSCVVITDPVWPNTVTGKCPIIGADRPYDLFREAIPEIERVAIRYAIHLGCACDPRFLSCCTLPFFRTCWLDFAVPGTFGRLLNSGDIAYLFGKPPLSIQGRHLIAGRCTATSHAIARDPADSYNPHPCPRRLQHCRFLVHNWSDPDETILDPFCGSATNGTAAIQLGRKFIGMEIDPQWVELANQRLIAAQAQTKFL